MTEVARSAALSVPLHVTAKADYALRAVLEVGAAGGRRVKGEEIATAQGIPLKFLLNIMIELRHAGIVSSRRGAEGGFVLARPAADITVGEVVRAVEGPVATVDGLPPANLAYRGSAEGLGAVWLAVQSRLDQVLDGTTLADVLASRLDGGVEEERLPVAPPEDLELLAAP
jgi:Rrf2 family protein